VVQQTRAGSWILIFGIFFSLRAVSIPARGAAAKLTRMFNLKLQWANLNSSRVEMVGGNFISNLKTGIG
jgi:hypothetical protein